jgi:hypothetical protein
MAKMTEAIVSAMGVLTSFLQALVNAVKEAGGSAEDIYHMVKPDGQMVLKAVARTIVANNKIRPYKNWPKICELIKGGRPIFAGILANADPQDEITSRLIVQFPEYFSDVPVKGPVPLSILRTYAVQQAIKQGHEPEEHPGDLGFYGALDKYEIPYLEFLNDLSKREQCHLEAVPLAPDSLDTGAEFGSTIDFDGKKWFVAQNSDDSPPSICICPLELIATDL